MLQSIRDGDRLIVRLRGELDHFCAQSVRRELDALLRDESIRCLILDFSTLTFMDSSGIGLILGRQRCARVLGTTLRLQHAPAQLQKVLRLAGIPCTENIEKENAQ